MKKIYYLVFGMFFLFAISLHAQNSSDSVKIKTEVKNVSADDDDDVIVAERPGYTNPPAVVDRKKIQIESGFNYESDKIKDTDFKTDNYLYPTTLIRYGLMKNVELRLQVDIAGFSTTTSGNKLTESGLNPVIIGAKFYMTKQKKAMPEAAFVFSLTLPYIGRDDFQPKYPAPGFAFYFLNTINSKWNIGYNLGMQWNGNDANPVSYVTFCPGYNITKKLAAFGEIYSFFAKESVPDIRCDAGLSYVALRNLQFDVSAGTGLAGPLSNYFISAGVAFRLPK